MLNNSQFILSKSLFKIDESWKVILLANAYYLSYQENLKVYTNDECSIVLVGDAWQVDITRNTPQEIISEWNKNTPLNEIYRQEETWCGRYLIITDRYILTDATGNLGCFYRNDAISNSIYLLRSVDNARIAPPHTQEAYSRDMYFILTNKQLINKLPEDADYIPGELTTDSQIRRLLPSTKLEYIKNEVSERPLLYTPIDKTQNNLMLFETIFLQNIKQMFRYYDGYHIWLPISGGKDSRVCLAAFEKLKKQYDIYTLYNPNSNHAGCYRDLGVSRLLAKKIQKKLHILKRLHDDTDDFELHTAGMSHTSYTKRTFVEGLHSDKECILQVKNNIWELASNDYDYHDVINTPEKIRDKWKGSANICEQSIERWLKLVGEEKTNSALSLGDRAYWDLRLGCWLADGMQGQDRMDNIKTINILNCRKFLSLLLGLDATTRGTRIYEIELTKKWSPSLAEVPYEESYYDIYLFYQKWKGKILRKMKKMINK